jgi:hypothetical protein
MGIPTVRDDLTAVVQRHSWGAGRQVAVELKEALTKLQHYGDFIPLRDYLRHNHEFEVERVLDPNTSQPFLLVRSSQQAHLLMVLNLDPRNPDQHIKLSPDDPAALKRFIDRRAAVLSVEGGN